MSAGGVGRWHNRPDRTGELVNRGLSCRGGLCEFAAYDIGNYRSVADCRPQRTDNRPSPRIVKAHPIGAAAFNPVRSTEFRP